MNDDKHKLVTRDMIALFCKHNLSMKEVHDVSMFLSYQIPEWKHKLFDSMNFDEFNSRCNELCNEKAKDVKMSDDDKQAMASQLINMLRSEHKNMTLSELLEVWELAKGIISTSVTINGQLLSTNPS